MANKKFSVWWPRAQRPDFLGHSLYKVWQIFSQRGILGYKKTQNLSRIKKSKQSTVIVVPKKVLMKKETLKILFGCLGETLEITQKMSLNHHTMLRHV
jgi:hypothetical protein